LLYGTRRLDGFFEALALIKKRKSPSADNIQFIQYDKAAGTSRLGAFIRQNNLSDTVHLRDRLSRPQLLSACKGADILLVVVGHDKGGVQHAGTIPGKLYDYFAACRPILVIGPRECEAARMVIRLNRGLAVPDDDPKKIAAAIELLMGEKGINGELELKPEAVQEFESAGMVKKMANFFNDVLLKQHKIEKA